MAIQWKHTFEIFFIFLRLGCTSFGGPVAHISYFHQEFITKRKWLTNDAYTELVALSHFLPGPASSQIGMALGSMRGGVMGSLAAFFGFTIPSALLMALLGAGFLEYGQFLNLGILKGLQIAAVSVIVHAIIQMGQKLCPDKERVTLAILAAIGSNLIQGMFGQVLMIIIGGGIGLLFFRNVDSLPQISFNANMSKKLGYWYLCIFLFLLVFLPLASTFFSNPLFNLFDRFYRIGSLVFGGGHVVIALLEEEIVQSGWIIRETFLVGYGFAQTLPGPLFTISAFIGAVISKGSYTFFIVLICLCGAFLPGYLLMIGILPFWESLRKVQSTAYVMKGISAVVVGLLFAVFYDPIFVSSVSGRLDFFLVSLSFVFLQFWKFPTWGIVIFLVTMYGITSQLGYQV